MNLIPWRNKRKAPVAETSPLALFRGEVDRLFDRFFESPWRGFEVWPGWDGFTPRVDVDETDKEVLVRAEVPGVDPKDVEVSIADGALVIAGEKKETETRRVAGGAFSERRFGSFRRSVPLPASVDAGSATAECANGVLTIRFKKDPSRAPRRVSIKVS